MDPLPPTSTLPFSQDPPDQAIKQWAFLGPFPRENDKRYPPEEKLDLAATGNRSVDDL